MHSLQQMQSEKVKRIVTVPLTAIIKSKNNCFELIQCGTVKGGHKSVNRYSVNNEANFFINLLIR